MKNLAVPRPGFMGRRKRFAPIQKALPTLTMRTKRRLRTFTKLFRWQPPFNPDHTDPEFAPSTSLTIEYYAVTMTVTASETT